jgi:hypothetical protein
MNLPSRLEINFLQELEEYEEGRKMAFVTSMERRGMYKLLANGLRAKFGEEAEELLPAIHELNDAEKYLALNRRIATATTLDEVRQAYADVTAPPSRRKKSGARKRGSSNK